MTTNTTNNIANNADNIYSIKQAKLDRLKDTIRGMSDSLTSIDCTLTDIINGNKGYKTKHIEVVCRHLKGLGSIIHEHIMLSLDFISISEKDKDCTKYLYEIEKLVGLSESLMDILTYKYKKLISNYDEDFISKLDDRLAKCEILLLNYKNKLTDIKGECINLSDGVNMFLDSAILQTETTQVDLNSIRGVLYRIKEDKNEIVNKGRKLIECTEFLADIPLVVARIEKLEAQVNIYKSHGESIKQSIKTLQTQYMPIMQQILKR